MSFSASTNRIEFLHAVYEHRVLVEGTEAYIVWSEMIFIAS